jgi:hypothetical protein
MPRGGRYRTPEYTSRVLAAYDAAEGRTRTARAKAAAVVAGVDRATVLRVVAERDGDGRDGKGPGAGSKTARCPERATETAEATAPAEERRPEVAVADGSIVATDRLYSLDDLLYFGAADRAAWYVSEHRFGWYGPTRNPCVQNQATLRPLPAFLRPEAEPPVIRRLPAPPRAVGAPTVVVALGDSHFGADRDQWTGAVEPYHDARALDLALQLVEHLAPDAVVLLGDLLDLPEWSTKYERSPEQEYTTGLAVEAARTWLQALRRAARHSRIVLLEGNHERRVRDYMAKVAKHAAVVRLPDGDPMVAVPRILGLAELDVEFIPADRDLRIDDVRYVHGDNREWADLGRVKSGGGATAAEMLKRATECTVYGHVHRDEAGARRVHDRGRYRRIWVASPGCLARDDGALPGERPDEDRSQGALVVTSWPDGRASRQVAEIEGGVMLLGQRRWEARPDSCSSQAAA